MPEASDDYLKVACVQTTTRADPALNAESMAASLAAAAEAGAAFVAFPETCNFMETNHKNMRLRVQKEADDMVLKVLCAQAARLKLWVSAGSMVLLDDNDNVVNRALIINPSGQVVARYDKIHMFDVALATGERHNESAHYQAGDKAVLAQIGKHKLGMSICYDVRFASLYRAYAQAGADFLIVPSAFTVPTGKAHWHILLRARAIETGCFVLAAAQCGTHDSEAGKNGRRTYGHSLIISPWGEIIAQAQEEQGIITATLDFMEVAKARQQVPSLLHGRNFISPNNNE